MHKLYLFAKKIENKKELKLKEKSAKIPKMWEGFLAKLCADP